MCIHVPWHSQTVAETSPIQAPSLKAETVQITMGESFRKDFISSKDGPVKSTETRQG